MLLRLGSHLILEKSLPSNQKTECSVPTFIKASNAHEPRMYPTRILVPGLQTATFWLEFLRDLAKRERVRACNGRDCHQPEDRYERKFALHAPALPMPALQRPSLATWISINKYGNCAGIMARDFEGVK